ncbi:hypothetical protein CDL15_Pgr015990 [Punica granatum]|uniref:Uncharacterized protein n=1 Tax=Punica granatum TaxID=22663 RepID=A0A218XPV1_PUNGR|nr:hypothetical protein CDL15_Pgr015990 [Punica granatum]PKI56678.1 hypothetical protein CRG98_022928 [Punica granatum]
MPPDGRYNMLPLVPSSLRLPAYRRDVATGETDVLPSQDRAAGAEGRGLVAGAVGVRPTEQEAEGGAGLRRGGGEGSGEKREGEEEQREREREKWGIF